LNNFIHDVSSKNRKDIYEVYLGYMPKEEEDIEY
jgi:hypothetical protein